MTFFVYGFEKKEKWREKKREKEVNGAFYYPFRGKFNQFHSPLLNHLPIVSWQQVVSQLKNAHPLTCITRVIKWNFDLVIHISSCCQLSTILIKTTQWKKTSFWIKVQALSSFIKAGFILYKVVHGCILCPRIDPLS